MRGGLAATLAIICALTSGPDAAAGPWTLPAGVTASYITTEARRAPAETDALGDPASGERYSASGVVSLERGLTDWATIGLKSESRAVWFDTDGYDALNAGEATREVWARLRLSDDPRAIVSTQLLYGQHLSGADVEPLELGERANAYEARFLLGRGFDFGPTVGWLAAEAAYRLRDHSARDQIHLDLTAGLRPRDAQRLLLYGQLFATKAVGDGDAGDYDILKLSANIGFEVTEQMTLTVGGLRELHVRGFPAGDRASLSLWVRY